MARIRRRYRVRSLATAEQAADFIALTGNGSIVAEMAEEPDQKEPTGLPKTNQAPARNPRGGGECKS